MSEPIAPDFDILLRDVCDSADEVLQLDTTDQLGNLKLWPW